MAIERIYNIPIRKDWLNVPKYKRAKKAVRVVREFLAKNMKTELDNVKLGKYLNLKVWEHGIKSPPHHIKVKVTKDDSGKVYAEIVTAPVEKKETVDQKVKKAEKITKSNQDSSEDVTEVKEAEVVSTSVEKKTTKKSAKKKE